MVSPKNKNQELISVPVLIVGDFDRVCAWICEYLPERKKISVYPNLVYYGSGGSINALQLHTLQSRFFRFFF